MLASPNTLESLFFELGGGEHDVIGVHELKSKLGRGKGIGCYGTEMGEEGGGESDGVDAEFPAFWIAGYDGISGGGE